MVLVRFSLYFESVVFSICIETPLKRKSNLSPEKELQFRAALEEALEAGYELLSQGKTSLEAVEKAICVMEECPLFNAGKGSVYTCTKQHELDASIMCGKTLQAGACAGVKTVKNPIKLAKHIMEHTEHVCLIGDGADQYAAMNQLEVVDNSYFDTEWRLQQLEAVINTSHAQLDHNVQVKVDEKNEVIDKKFGTVGCVALDQFGNLAAGTSTGGMTNKKYGRVGDSPIIGAGTFANNATAAISSTGWGEYFMRYCVAHDISAAMEYGNMDLESACKHVVWNKLAKAQEDTGGVIALDTKGNIVMEFNTEGMYRGMKKSTDKKAVIEIYKKNT